MVDGGTGVVMIMMMSWLALNDVDVFHAHTHTALPLTFHSRWMCRLQQIIFAHVSTPFDDFLSLTLPLPLPLPSCGHFSRLFLFWNFYLQNCVNRNPQFWIQTYFVFYFSVNSTSSSTDLVRRLGDSLNRFDLISSNCTRLIEWTQ